MSIRDENIDSFDAYLRGEMPLTEREVFDKRLKEDKAFQEAFDHYQDDVVSLKMLGIRQEMQEVMDKEAKPNKQKYRYFIPLGVAAALALLLLAFPQKTQDFKPLFDEYFVPYPDAVSGREGETELSKALNNYTAGNYKEAIVLFDLLPPSDTVLFYRSLSHLALKETGPAHSGFNKIVNESLFYESTQWYAGLGFLLAGRDDSTRLLLNRITVRDANYEKAQTILRAISEEDDPR